MKRCNLEEYTAKINKLRERRDELGYAGSEDLSCIRKIESIHHDVARELIEIRAKLEICPIEMIRGLKAREYELLEWKRRY